MTRWLSTLLLLLSLPYLLHATADYSLEDPSSRIVGGNDAVSTSYPYYVALTIQTTVGYSACGGSLIHSDIVLTTAHCINNDGDFIEITAHMSDGSHYKSTSQPVPHPQFDRSISMHHDIMILRLDQPVHHTITPVPFNDDSSIPAPGQPVQAIGWGRLSEGGDRPDALQVVTLHAWSNHECAVLYADTNIKTTTQLCAGEENKGFCSGDSGGPIVTSTGPIVLVAMPSYSYGCARTAGVSTRVSAYAEWIRESICNLSQQQQQQPAYCGPTNSPTVTITSSPTASPSSSPTNSPTVTITSSPTASPSSSPTLTASNNPTNEPTVMASNSPTRDPTVSPSKSPTNSPTVSPSNSPTSSPTVSPSNSPTSSPTVSPSNNPTSSPSVTASSVPSNSPTTSAPTVVASTVPSSSSSSPSSSPPSSYPSRVPSNSPTTMASSVPSSSPSVVASSLPTRVPSTSPSLVPSTGPSSRQPSALPSLEPSTSTTPSLQHSSSPSMMTQTPSIVPSTTRPSYTLVPSATPSRSSLFPTTEGLAMFLESFENKTEDDPAGVKVFLDFLNNGGLSPSTSPSEAAVSEAPSVVDDNVVRGSINNSTAEEDASVSAFLDSFEDNETIDGRGDNATDRAVETFLDYVQDNNITTADHPYIIIEEPTIDVIVVLNFDSFASEISWEIMSWTGESVAWRGRGTYTDGEQSVNETVSLIREEQYVFRIFDAGGNGMCCEFGHGNVILFLQEVSDETVLLVLEDAFQLQQSGEFMAAPAGIIVHQASNNITVGS